MGKKLIGICAVLITTLMVVFTIHLSYLSQKNIREERERAVRLRDEQIRRDNERIEWVIRKAKN